MIGVVIFLVVAFVFTFSLCKASASREKLEPRPNKLNKVNAD